MKIKLRNEWDEMIKSTANVVTDYKTSYSHFPQVYIQDEEDKGTSVYEEKLMSSMTKDELMQAGVELIFSLGEVKEIALAMADWGEGIGGTLPPEEYFKQRFGIDLSKH